MIGRAAHLGRLVALVAAAAGGEEARPAVALVAGEAGLGKTRLLQELLASVPPGALVLAGQAEPGSLGRPLDLVRQLQDLPRPTLRAVPDPARPRLVDAAPGPEVADQVATAGDDLLARVAGQPSLLVFEDLHWADAESVAVFERLAVAGPGTLVLVGTFRPEELTRRQPAGEMIVRLERRQQVTQLRLEPLSRADVASFLNAVYERELPARVAGALHRRTGGNPFFLEELLAAAGDAPPEDLAEQPLPWTLAELVRAQLDGLTPTQRRVVEAAAVLGPRADFDVLASMLRISEDDLIDELRGLVARGLLVEDAPDELRFRHALVRDAVEGQLLGRERRRLHDRALSALREGCACDLAALAAHAAGADRPDDLVALAREGAPTYLTAGSSYQAYELALRGLEEEPDDLLLRSVAARAAWLLGHNLEAAEHAQRWRSLAAAGDEEGQSAALRTLARSTYELGRLDELPPITAEIERLTARLPAGVERARALALLAQVNMLTDHPQEAIVWADRAVAEAGAIGAEDVRVQALLEKASATGHLRGRGAEGEALLREVVERAEAIGEWVVASRGLNNLFEHVCPLDTEIPELLDRLKRDSERAGFSGLGPVSHALHSATRALWMADGPGMRQWLDRSAELTPLLREWAGNWLAGMEMELALEADRLDDAARFWQQLRSDTPADRFWKQEFGLRLAGRRGDASGIVAGSLSDLPAWWARRAELCGTLLDRLESGAAAGLGAAQLNELVAPLLEDEALAAASSNSDLPARELAEAWLAAVEPDHERAAATLAGVLPQVEGRLAVPFVATLEALLARSLASLTRRPEAVEVARRARARLERWPGWRRDEIDALLARLEAAGDGELTAREREVAALLAEGLTNAELARRLYISPRTAAVHVSNILMKLGMANRAEVAAWAVRTGLARGPAA